MLVDKFERAKFNRFRQGRTSKTSDEVDALDGTSDFPFAFASLLPRHFELRTAQQVEEMAGAPKSQELISQLLNAEKQAEELISTAKQNRLAKLKEAKTVAEKDLQEFRQEEEKKFQKEMGSKQNVDPAAEYKSSTQQELNMVEADYKNNKAAVVKYIVSKVLDVPLELSATQIQSLKAGTV
eukprot:CAMPEP_0178400618 /NCGR_PEP_ID=MMETSP0689_2-20121128/15882_1 /TAXON_ID=160604 /ORGANISM="Amphidinium massartii, Strain CS-259" /LENGTH=181 /DNA_ID=CAMNT_0020021419 /DNA_START=52 /DNA_END=598 /DNA_ORIENTATION=-